MWYGAVGGRRLFQEAEEAKKRRHKPVLGCHRLIFGSRGEDEVASISKWWFGSIRIGCCWAGIDPCPLALSLVHNLSLASSEIQTIIVNDACISGRRNTNTGCVSFTRIRICKGGRLHHHGYLLHFFYQSLLALKLHDNSHWVGWGRVGGITGFGDATARPQVDIWTNRWWWWYIEHVW